MIKNKKNNDNHNNHNNHSNHNNNHKHKIKIKIKIKKIKQKQFLQIAKACISIVKNVINKQVIVSKKNSFNFKK